MVSGSSERHLDTPALVVDERAALTNIAEVGKALSGVGIRLRSDVSVHRSARLARLQLRAGPGMPVAAARIEDAVALAGHGFSDIQVTWPLTTAAQLARLAGLLPVANVIAVTDGPANIHHLARIATASGRRLRVAILLDVRGTGWGAASAEAAGALSRSVQETRVLEPAGLLAPITAATAGPSLERLRMVRLELSAAGSQLPITVVIPDPRAILAAPRSADEVVSAHYVFGSDGIEAARDLWITAAVISRQRPGVAVIDCGQKSVGLDGTTPDIGLPGSRVRRINAEHAIVELPANTDLAINDVVRFHPRNVPATVLLNNRYHVMADDGSIRTWPIDVAPRG